MFFLIPILISAGGGLLLWKTNIGERLLSRVLSRVLRALGEHGADVHALSNGRGISISKFRLREDIGLKLGVAIDLLELRWPTFTLPMQINLKGATITIAQKQMPKRISTKKFFDAIAKASVAKRIVKLQAIDECLWSSTCIASSTRGGWAARYMNAWLQWALYNVILFAISLLQIHAADMLIKCRQQGQPGPNGSLEGGDGLSISIRQFKLSRSGAAVDGSTSEDDSPEMEVMPQVIRNVAKAASNGRVPDGLEGKQLQISVSGVNVWLETWRGHCHPDEVQENLNTGEAGGAVKRYGELLSHPQSLPHWPSTGEAQQVDAVLENGRHHAMDSNMSHTGTSHSPAKQRTVEQIRKMEVLKQWGATVIVLVSSRPLEGQPLPRGSVVPAWKKESDASVKLAHRQASQNNGWPEYEEGADRNCEADECSEEDKEAKSQKAPARRRLNPSETVSWIKLLVQSLRPLISGPAALGGRKKARKQGKTLSNENSQHCFLRLDVELNAAILQLQPDSVACLLRILKRLSFVQKFSCHWQVRPESSVASDPVSWWQHAGRAVLQELRDRMRVQFGLHKMEERREKRLRYMDLYSTVHQGHLRWQVQPNATLWRRVTECPSMSVAAARKELMAMEQDLEVGEIAGFRFMAACKHNSVLSSDYNKRLCLAHCVTSIANSPTPLTLRPHLLGFMHGANDDTVENTFLVPDVQIRMAKVGVVLNSAEAQNILASLHGLSLSVSPDHEFKMVAQCAHVGSATKHLEPGPLALVTAPCSEAMSAGLESQAAWGKVFKGARNNFLEIIATPAEYFTAESFGQHEDEGSCVVPRDHINIRVSGIEVHSVQVVMVDLLKAGREVMKAQAKGLKENTNLSGYGDSLSAYVVDRLKANNTVQQRSGRNPLPVVQFTSLGVMFRSPYTCDPAKYLHGGAHKGELSISFPAFKGTLMGMQSYDATGVFHDLGKNSGTQLWSPDNEVLVVKFTANVSIAFRPPDSNSTVLQEIWSTTAWDIPGEERVCPPRGKEPGQGSILPLVLVRHMQMHLGYSVRSFPSVRTGITSAWGHNTCEAVLVWLSPYQHGPMSQAHMNRMMEILKTDGPPPSATGDKSGVTGRKESLNPTTPIQPLAAVQSSEGVGGQSLLNAGFSFHVRMISVYIAALREGDGIFEPGTGAGRSQVERAVAKSHSLTHFSNVNLMPALELSIVNLHGVVRAYYGTQHFSYNTRVDGVFVRNLEHDMSHPQAFFLRPHLFLCSRLASMSAKIRQEALAQEVPPMTVIWRLMQQAWRQEYIVNTACNGYCLPHKYWTQRINKLAKLSDNSKYSTISANLVIDLKPGRRPIINVDYHMTDIRMFVSVTTLSTILTTATQCMVLNSLRAKASNAQPAAKPTKSPAPQLAPNASEEDSGIVRALKSAQVKVEMAVLGSLVDLVARDDRRVMSISLRECGLGLDVPADRLVSKKGPPADGRLLFARFSIGDMLIRDTMARELHSVVLRSALGTRRCSLDMVFGIHQTGPCSVKHVLEINIDNPYLLLMLRFVNNTLYCVKDVLKALKDQQAAVDEVEAAPAASCRQVPPPEPEQKPQAKKAKPGEAPLGFMMRLCIRKATVLVPHSSHSRESLALQLEQLLVGFPSAALVEQEMPAHCSQAGGLLGDSNAIEQCHLIGRPGEITRKGNRPAIDARLAARIQHFSLCTGVLAKVGGTAKVAASEVSEDISPDGAPAYKSTQAHMPNEQTHKRKQLEISVAGVRLLGPVPILHNVQNVYAVLSLDPGLHIHTSLPRLNVSFSNRAYNAIMNFVGGNLVEGNSFEAPVLPPARKLSTKYRHAQAFGPPAGDKASVRVTVFASTLQLYLLAQPSRWENQATEENSPATPSGQEDAQAFLRIRLTNFIINLGMLQPSGNLHIDLGSGGLEIDDLRFSSRPMPITKGRPENDTLREEESGQFKLLDVDFVQINDRPVFRSHEVPLVQIVQAPWDLPANESLHLDDEEYANVMSIRFTMLTDGTMAAEVAVSQAVAQWPFLEDLSLVFSILSILQRPPTEVQPAGQPQPVPWFYFNFMFRHLDNMARSRMGMGLADVQDAGISYNNNATSLVAHACKLLALGRNALPTPDANPLFKIQHRHSGGPASPPAQPLVSSAFVATVSCFRFGYFMGGDGETKLPLGIDKCAVFVRHSHAVMTALVLPFSMSLTTDMQKAELEANRKKQAALIIQHWWRQVRHSRAARSRLDVIKRADAIEIDNIRMRAAEVFMMGAVKAQANVPSVNTIDIANRLIRAMLDERAAKAVEAVENKSIQTVQDGLGAQGSYAQMPFTIDVSLKCTAVTIRLASSNLFVIKELLELTKAPEASQRAKDTDTVEDDMAPQPGTEEVFRPMKVTVDLSVNMASLVICNDRPQSYGAPDFLLLSTKGIALEMYSERLLPNRRPDIGIQFEAESKVDFLNNSSGSWQQLMAFWPIDVHARISGSGSSTMSYSTEVSVHSQERLESTFSPALLLSLGDLNSFLGDARAIIGADGPPNMQAWYGKDKPHAPMPPPSMEEQLAMKRDLTGRVPQKYLIQNLTGLTLCYWSGDPSASNVHTHYLCNGGEETLKVEPSDDWGTITSGTKAKTAIRFLRKVLHVRFQGNWMPIKRIVVNHIGKFSYMLVSPHDGLRVPLLVDISLKARTKIISVHSTVKVRNCSDATLHFRLKLPTLAAVGPASDGLHQESEGPAFKGPRPTKTNKCEHAAKQTLGTNVVDLGWHGYDGNCYLPVQSVVDGMLYVQARNYEESLRDVILLKPNIKDMENQQGTITCQMADDLGGDFHCAVLVKPIIAGQQAVCHSSSGIMDSTEEALECEVQLTPTIQLQNGLPYPMIVTLNECEDSSHSRPPGVNMEPSPGHGMNVTLKQLRSEGFSMHSAKGSSLHMPSGMWGDQTCRILLPPGTTSDVYMNLKKNVYAKFEVPALKLKCAEWVVLHKCHALKHRAQFHYDAEQFDEEERKELKRIRAAEPKEIRMVKPQPDGSIRRGGVVHGSDCVGILRHHATRPSVDAVDNRHGACGAPQGQLPRARSSFRSTVQPKQHCSPAPQGTSARSMRPDWPRPPAPGLPSDTAVEAQEPVRLRIEATDSRTTGTNMSVQDLEDQGLGLTDDPVRLALEAGGDGRVRVKLQLAALGEEDVAPVPDAAACHLHAPDARGRESFPTAPNEGDNSEATTPVDVPFPDTEEPPVRLCLQVTDAGVEGVRLVQDDEQGIRAGGGPQTQRGRTVKLEYIPTSTGVTAVKLIPAQPAAIPAPGHQRQQLASRAPGSGGISSKASPGSKILSPSVLSMGGWNSRSAAVAPSTLPDFGDDFASSEELLNENLDDSIMCPAETLFNIWREDYAGRSMRVVTISAPYWVNNVTGYHLVFADERSAGTQTTLCGEMFTEVLVPFQAPRKLDGSLTPAFLPSLLNQQSSSKFRIAASSTLQGTSYSSKFKIGTVRQPQTVELKGIGSVPDYEAPPGLLLYHTGTDDHSLDRTAFWISKQVARERNDDFARLQGLIKARANVTRTAVSVGRSDSLSRLNSDASAQGMSGVGPSPSLRSSQRWGSILASPGSLEKALPSGPQTVDGNPAAMMSNPEQPDSQSRPHGRMPDAPIRTLDASDSGVARWLHLMNQPAHYHVTMEVKPAPSDTVFQHSKVIEIRNKYVVENLTGMDIEIKQVGLPDIEDLQGILRSDQLARLRNRRVIPNGGAAPLVRLRAAPKSKGDKVELASEICIRPDDGEWEWSGQYTPEEKEQYFGMRLIHKVDKDKFLILPVTVSVGKGTVLVSLQSATSVPPYRLSNVCSSLKIYFIQEGIYSDSQPVDRRGSLNPGSSLDYAFDEPMLPHRIVLAAMSPSGKLVASAIDMDRVGHTQVWILPASAPVTQSDRQDAEDPEMARRRTELQRMASKHLNKKIYLEVYADGPTRTLRISETKGYSQEREVHQIVDLATDIRQLGTLLRNLNRQFIAVFGTQDGARQIDMYGRSLDKHGYTIMDHGFSAQEQREGLSRLSYSTAKAGPMAAVQPIPDANRTVNPGQQAMIEDEAGPSHPHGRYRQRKAIKTVKGKAPEVGYQPATSASTSNHEGRSVKKKVKLPPDDSENEDSGSVEHKTSEKRQPVGVQHSDEVSQRNLLAVLEVMQEKHNSDLELMVGGELSVTILCGENLSGDPSHTNPFVVLRVGNEIRGGNVLFETVNPDWNYQINFMEVVSLSSEIEIDVYDLAGTADNADLHKLGGSLGNVDFMVKTSRFLGRAVVPLNRSIMQPSQRLILSRRQANDAVSGSIQIRFSWDISAKSLLILKKQALERVIAQRTEIMSLLYPVDSTDMKAKIEAAESSIQKAQAVEKQDHNDGASTSDVTTATEDFRFSDILNEAKRGTLAVTVVAAKGLSPHKHNPLAAQLQSSSLPDSYVEVVVFEDDEREKDKDKATYRTEVVLANTTPAWESNNSFFFKQVSFKSSLRLRMLCKFGWAGRFSKLAELVVPMEAIRYLKNPTHAWLELKFAQSTDKEIEMTAKPPQLLVRLAFSEMATKLEHINHHITVDLKGVAIALLHARSDDQELLNITYSKIQLDVRVGEAQAEIKGAIHSLQIDNQLVTATKPVVLSPNARNIRSSSALDMTMQPMIKFTAVRSFQMENFRGGHGGEQKISSFKEIDVFIGEMDFQADENLLEHLLNFVVDLPFEDLSQDAPLAVASDLDYEKEAAITLRAVGSDYMDEIHGIRGSSSSSSWFFIENLTISKIRINTTISVTSSLVNSTNKLVNFGSAGKYLGAAGFSLVNVSNVPLSLNGMGISSELLSINNLVGRATRHYFREGLGEAHKVMGGSGPGLAGLPLTLFWAAGSVYDIGEEIFQGELSCVAAVQKGGFVVFTAVGQMIGALSKTTGTLLLLIPPKREDARSDIATMARFIVRPSHAPEALWRGVREPVRGIYNALLGLCLDPLAGAHRHGVPGAIYGAGKGILGLLLRPVGGILEGGAKLSEGIGLLCLGEAGVSGTLASRVRAPGTLQPTQQALTYADEDARNEKLASWHASLLKLVPTAVHDKVVDVITYELHKVLLITNNRVIWLNSKVQKDGYNPFLGGKFQWITGKHLLTEPDKDGTVLDYNMTRCIKIKNLQAVTGKAERQAITVYYNKKLGGTPIKIPATTTFRCSTADIYQKVIYLIHNQNSKVRRGGGGDRKPEYRSDASKWAIFRAPFPAPPAPVEVSMERVGAWNDGTSGTSAEIETGSQNHKNSVGHAIDND